MKAIVVHQVSGEPRLVWEDVADVDYDPDEVLVNVKATAVNRADLSQARGGYPPPTGVTEILGLEMAGEIVAVGNRVERYEIGDRVCALLAGGGYAEQVAVHHEMLLPIPEQWSFEQGAAVPEVWYTAFVNLFREGELKSGETVLIHAGGSGVGTAAIQLAREASARVFVTAGTEAKLAACRELGAELTINYKTSEFKDKVLEATKGMGVDLILDPVGGSYLESNISCLGLMGRLVNIGLLGGRKGELEMGLVLSRRLRIIGSRLRSRPLEEKIDITRAFRQGYWPLLESGTLHPVIDSVFPIADAQAAHEYVALNKNLGKVILIVG